MSAPDGSTDQSMSRPSTHTRPAKWVTGALLGAALIGGVPAAAQPTDAVSAARERLATATSVRESAEGRLSELNVSRRRLRGRLAASSAELNALATQIAEARRMARQRAVDAFIADGNGGQLVAILGSARAEDAAARSALLVNQVESAADAADLYTRMKEQNDPEVVQLGVEIDEVDRQIAAAQDDLLQAAALEADAERSLAAALVAERDRARAAATSTTIARRRPAPVRAAPSAPEGTNPDKWAKLVKCESGGDYSIVSSTGRYRGAYQFDQRTWESVGGVGDPAAAAPAEQDLRARLLYERRGTRAWPHCGRHLLRG